jgi:hypothetical protein
MVATTTTSKVDFTARVVESFSGFHLDGGGDARILGRGVEHKMGWLRYILSYRNIMSVWALCTRDQKGAV